MPLVTFSHAEINGGDPLVIETGADQIEWGYGLNHITYPTYGGEVTQILSAYVDDLTIAGTCRTYHEMEDIYKWFLSYIRIASQGSVDDATNYTERAIQFSYPERGWNLKVQVLQLPGFRYATDVVAPSWQVQCHVVDRDPNMDATTLKNAKKGLARFGKLDASIGSGDPATNPFSNPFPDKTKIDPEKTAAALKKVGDYYGTLIDSYTSGDFGSLFGSGPMLFLDGQDSLQTKTSAPKK